MEIRKVLNNYVVVKLDPENNVIETPSGFRLYIDTSFEKEKHLVVLGEVIAVPNNLTRNGMPWITDMELQVGDKVVMYYLAVHNCLSKEQGRSIVEGKTIHVIISYNNIYAAVRDGKIIPINGYILAETTDNPEIKRLQERMAASGLVMPQLNTKNNTRVVYMRARYIGKPLKKYFHDFLQDDGVEVGEGDVLVCKRIRDIPIEYEYHAKLGKGTPLFRIQRHDILAKL